MSSGVLRRPSRPELFEWAPSLDPADYVRVTYEVAVSCPADDAAFGMAMEQSAATTTIAGHVVPDGLEAWTIRVVETQTARPRPAVVPGFSLKTEVYGAPASTSWIRVVLAIPSKLIGRTFTQWSNVVVGELPRLGFVHGFRVVQAEMPDDFGPGPGWGIPGIRERFGVPRGPILCRSMRPGVGLSTEVMAGLNRAVLEGGFHAVKDDELQLFSSNADFAAHVQAMVGVRDAVAQAVGEKKSFIATLMCDPEDLETRWRICVDAGVDAVLVAPFVQGLGTLKMLAQRRVMPILGHNTTGELSTRHPDWGVADAVYAGWLRHAGADWLTTPGAYGHQIPPPTSDAQTMAAMTTPGSLAPVMPILQGGKRPSELGCYVDVVGSADFMLIVASWVDGHPDGLASGAAEFRRAVDAS